MNPPLPPPPLPAPRNSAAAIWSLVLGVLGFAFCLPSIAGIVCAIVALIQTGRSNNLLRGTGLAVAGLLVSIIGAAFSAVLGPAILIPLLVQQSEVGHQTLIEARRGFVTKLVRNERTGFPVPKPPAAELNLVHYRSPIGELPAYLSPIPNDGRKHPAIIWLTGGFSNSISENVWDVAPPENDQTARIFRQLGVVTLYPSYRGGNENPGYRETLFGEVNDVLAAADFLAAQPGIDRIYLGGHSTGGTLALLVAEMSPRFRAVFSFGPIDRIGSYGEDSLMFDRQNIRELQLRDPIRWLDGIKSPTYIFEGEEEPCNIDSLHKLRATNHNPLIQFFPAKGKAHFSIIAPYSRSIAEQIRTDTGATPNFTFPQK
jgi:pimeloyl-ACP methyl ester carboxylesterase